MAQGKDGWPGLSPRRRVINRERVLDRLLVDAGKALGNLEGSRIGITEGRFGPEIRVFHDQCVALPMAARIPMPLMDVGRNVGATFYRDDANLASDLSFNGHVSRALPDEQIAVVFGR